MTGPEFGDPDYCYESREDLIQAVQKWPKRFSEETRHLVGTLAVDQSSNSSEPTV